MFFKLTTFGHILNFIIINKQLKIKMSCMINVSWAQETLKAAEKEDMNPVHLWSVWFLPWSLDRNDSIAVGW